MTAPLYAGMLLTQGRKDAAAAVIGAWLDSGIGAVRGWQQLGATAIAAATAADTGDAELCRRLYTALLPYDGQVAVTGGAVSIHGPVALHLGRLAAVTGRPDADAHLSAAARTADRLDARGWSALARAEHGRLLLGRDPATAETLLRGAADTAEAIGMPWLAERVRAALAGGSKRGPAFRRDGEVWELSYDGTTIRLPDAKGLHDIATLLANAGTRIPAAQLVGNEAEAEARYGADDLVDDSARAAYRQRLADLDTYIDDAVATNDPERAARARREKDELVQALTAAYGIGRRPRRLGDANERARKTVTARIRDSIGRIAERHPGLGEHLGTGVHTGVLCWYDPP
jgi:hypothetical protein